MSEEEEQSDIVTDLDIIVFKMIKRCIDLATVARTTKDKAKILGILGDLEVTHEALGSLVFAMCNIDSEDFKDYFVEDNAEMLSKLTEKTED